MGMKFQIEVRGLDDDFCTDNRVLDVIFEDIESASKALNELALFEQNRRKALSFVHSELRSDFIAANLLPCMELFGDTQIDFASDKGKPFYGMNNFRNVIIQGKKIAVFWGGEYYFYAFKVVIYNAPTWVMRNY